jgi:hypothetical protein
MDELFEVLAWCEQKSERENRKFLDDFRRDTAGWRPQPEDYHFLRLITTGRISERALLSNVHVHRAAQDALVGALTREYKRYPYRQWLWITLACDIGVTWERFPFIDTVALCNAFSQHLRRCGLQGFAVLEIDIWKNITGEPGRRVVPHVHFVGYTRDDGRIIDIHELERELCARRALKNSLGARPADVQEITVSATDFAQIGRYMLKRPAYAKNPIPQSDGTHLLKDVEHARGSVARLVEIQSRVEVGDVIFSIGKGAGKSVADTVRKAVAHVVRKRPGAKPAPSHDQVIKHWNRIRLINGSRKFEECVVISRTEQRNSKDGESV